MESPTGVEYSFRFVRFHRAWDTAHLVQRANCVLCQVALPCMDGIQRWALMLLLHGKAVDHLHFILRISVRGMLLLPSSSSAQSSVVCSPHSHFLFSVSPGGSAPPAPLGLLFPPLLNPRVLQMSFLFPFEFFYLCPFFPVILSSALSLFRKWFIES